ncbi:MULTISPECIES: hypothetical protein [Clostridium]|uniref:Uncharacterized protein n=1 Tax=Clostridium frigoriphilum TaxID=443253 RepID=A0ABU7UTT7_9CLOT|nr:hypothetical protein [Clostridium sp. DSM 17811]
MDIVLIEDKESNLEVQIRYPIMHIDVLDSVTTLFNSRLKQH